MNTRARWCRAVAALFALASALAACSSNVGAGPESPPGAAGTYSGSAGTGSSNAGTNSSAAGRSGAAGDTAAGGAAGAGALGGSSSSGAGSGGTTAGSAPGGSAGAGAGGVGGSAGANLFSTLSGKTQQEVDEKVKLAVERFFGIGTGEPTTPTAGSGYRCYYELPGDPSLAFIWAADSNDVRSEGMSYGMMIAVQMGMKTEFDKLWKFAKTYMQYPPDTAQTAWKYYFRWQGTVSGGTVNFPPTQVPAPDGDEYFAAALYLADARWGSAGGVSYRQEADNISTALLHNAATADGRYPIIHTTQNMVVFVPYGNSYGFTDPSYHLPGFYELFALRGPAADSAKWKSLAATSRSYLVASAHASTGLHPDYATFAGAPSTGSPGDGHDQFKYDAWRVVLNMAVDHAWFSHSPELKAQIEKYHAFFAEHLATNNVSSSLFHVDGSSPSGGGSTALTATLAAGALASSAPERKTYVDNLWNVAQQSGQYRYYQEGVYLLGLLAVAGKYRYGF